MFGVYQFYVQRDGPPGAREKRRRGWKGSREKGIERVERERQGKEER